MFYRAEFVYVAVWLRRAGQCRRLVDRDSDNEAKYRIKLDVIIEGNW